MPRRREVPKRKVLPDPRYHDRLLTKFMNSIMRDGKKAVAENILYGAFDVIHARTREDPLDVFHKAVANAKPVVEVKKVEAKPAVKLVIVPQKAKVTWADKVNYDDEDEHEEACEDEA